MDNMKKENEKQALLTLIRETSFSGPLAIRKGKIFEYDSEIGEYIPRPDLDYWIE